MGNDDYLKGKQIKTDFIDNELATNKHFWMVHIKIKIGSIFEDNKKYHSQVFLKESKYKFKEQTIKRFITKNWLIFILILGTNMAHISKL